MKEATVHKLFPVLTEEEAAEYLRVPVFTMAELRKEGKGPKHINLKGKIRYLRTSIDEWLKKKEKKTPNSGE